MPITVQPFEDSAAYSVFRFLDHADHSEAEITRGQACTPLSLFADWRAVSGIHLLSLLIRAGGESGQPFAVLALCNTGQSGVAQAALLARDHVTYKRELIELALRIRRDMPGFCAKHAIHRIEARAWCGHPRAGRFLRAIGFSHEVRMGGFGPRGNISFDQYAFASCAHDERSQTNVPYAKTA